MCGGRRQQAFDMCLDHARNLGANAIIGLAYDSSEVGAQTGATEVLCYGTAVVIVPSGN